jgi:hypothetical protein
MWIELDQSERLPVVISAAQRVTTADETRNRPHSGCAHCGKCRAWVSACWRIFGGWTQWLLQHVHSAEIMDALAEKRWRPRR